MNRARLILQTFLPAFLTLNVSASESLALPQHFRIETPTPINREGERDSLGFTNTFAIVRDTKGEDVDCLSSDFEWTRIRVGSKLSSGDIIRTGPASVVDLFLEDNGPTLRLGEGSLLTLTKLKIRRKGEEKGIIILLNLQRGRLLGKVKDLSENSRFETLTPQGIAGIRGDGGTEFDIRAERPITFFTGSPLYFPHFFRWRSSSADSLVPISPMKLEVGKNGLSHSILNYYSPLSTAPPVRNIFLER